MHFSKLSLINLILTIKFNQICSSDLPARDPIILLENNFDSVTKHSEIVFVSFVAEWCHFSRLLTPVWLEASRDLSKKYSDQQLAFATVQTDKGGAALGTKYGVNKYPTMKLFRHGTVSKKEYRGARSSEAFSKYIESELRSNIVNFENNNQIDNGGQHSVSKEQISKLNRDDRNLIGFFESTDSDNYRTFNTISGSLKDDCKFWAGVGDGIKDERISGDNIVFRPEGSNNADNVFMGDLSNVELITNWITEKCIPLVREINFQNGEELTEEGKPFLILFHKKEDTASLDAYKVVAETELINQRDKLTILHADCEKFAHPLWHLGKNVNSCPVIAIDSFKHMYTFNDFKEIHTKGKLLTFVEDLHSGKLHREFHNGPDPMPVQQIEQKKAEKIKPEDIVVETKLKIETVKKEPGQDPNKAELKVVEEKVLVNKKDGSILETTINPNGSPNLKKKRKGPVESQFAKLRPSQLGYSLKRDEL